MVCHEGHALYPSVHSRKAPPAPSTSLECLGPCVGAVLTPGAVAPLPASSIPQLCPHCFLRAAASTVTQSIPEASPLLSFWLELAKLAMRWEWPVRKSCFPTKSLENRVQKE